MVFSFSHFNIRSEYLTLDAVIVQFSTCFEGLPVTCFRIISRSVDIFNRYESAQSTFFSAILAFFWGNNSVVRLLLLYLILLLPQRSIAKSIDLVLKQSKLSFFCINGNRCFKNMSYSFELYSLPIQSYIQSPQNFSVKGGESVTLNFFVRDIPT